MAYSKQNFQNGQILNAANLEAMENGIIAGQGAHNLLDNSDFTNPVNQRGQTSYTGAGDTIDRWKAGVSDCSMYVNAGKSVAFNTKTEGVNAYWRQYLPHSLSQLEGKTFTLAIKDAWGKTHCASGVYPTSAPSDTKSVIWINMYENVSIVLYCATDGTAFVQLTTKKSVPISWVALYEGSYTTDTLPSYVSKGKHVEMLNCGVSLAPHNLLDNSDFRNPVNQRGQSSYTANGYTIDRWRDTTNTTVNINSGSISIVNNSSSSNAYLRQRLAANVLTAGKAYTMAINIGGTVYMGSAVIQSGSSVTFYGKDGLYLACTGLTSNEYWTIQIAISGGYSFSNVLWAALYEGSYTADTLPAYVPKGYAAELAECQRYYYQTWDGAKPSSGAKIPGIQIRHAIAASRLLNVEFPVAMRIKPTITLYTSDFIEGAVRNWNNSSDTITGVIAVYGSTKGFVPGKEANDFTNGAPYSFHYSASADL